MMWWWCLRTTRLLKSASPSTRWERSSDLSLSTTLFCFVILLKKPDISTISNSYEETISPKRERITLELDVVSLQFREVVRIKGQ